MSNQLLEDLQKALSQLEDNYNLAEDIDLKNRIYQYLLLSYSQIADIHDKALNYLDAIGDYE